METGGKDLLDGRSDLLRFAGRCSVDELGMGVGDAGMTREQVVKQVMMRVDMAKGLKASAHESLGRWVAMFPKDYVFGSHEVMAAIRMVRRELGLR
jgi:hypothetical protein